MKRNPAGMRNSMVHEKGCNGNLSKDASFGGGCISEGAKSLRMDGGWVRFGIKAVNSTIIHTPD